MPVTRRPDQPWYHSLTIDVFIKVLAHSIFHPFVAALIPMSLCAGGFPLHAPAVWNTIYWAIFISILHAMGPLNERIAYGRPRKVVEEDEIMVITGGASGLGKCIAETYAIKGGTVAVLDIHRPDVVGEATGIRYFECDVTDSKKVAEAWGMIKKELGTPTVVINCAGIVHGKSSEELTTEEVSRSFAVNTIAHYALNKLFLAGAKESENGGTIVTVSSVLGRLGAAQLSAYTATKAALLAYHNSLVAELVAYPNIKTIMVATGQLSTEMFSGLEPGPIEHFFGPTVEVSDLAVKIIKKILDGRSGVIAEPAFARWISVMDVLPVGIQQILRRLAGVDTAMKSFKQKG